MPTPDTDALAARLRAVERALTDDDTTLDPPNEGAAGGEPNPEPADVSGASEPDAEVRDRLCRLEASVQALHAALGGIDADREPAGNPTTPGLPDQPGTTAGEQSAADTQHTDGTPGTAADRALDRPRDPVPDHEPREPRTGWPDDLAAE